MEEKKILEEQQQEEVSTLYSDALEVAALAKRLYFEATKAGDYEKAQVFYNQWQKACEKIREFDEVYSANYKTDKEVEAKITMNQLDNETKIETAKIAAETELEIALREQSLAKAQFIANCITGGLNIGLAGAGMALDTGMTCGTLACECDGFNPDVSKTSRKMVSFGNKWNKNWKK